MRCLLVGCVALAACGADSTKHSQDLAWPVDDSGVRHDLAMIGSSNYPDLGVKPDLAPPPPACDYQPVAQSGTLSLDLSRATVSGEVQLNGAQMPDNSLGTATRGSLRFVDRKTADSITADLGASGPATFNLTLFAGTYDVLLDGGSSQDALPYSSTVLLTGLQVSGTVQKSFNAATATVSGSVTLGGAQLPDNSLGTADRGSIEFVDDASRSTTSAPLGAAGAAAYHALVFAGNYDVRLVGGSSQNALPDQSIILVKAFAINATTTRSFDVTTAHLTGAVTLNGVQLPNNTLGTADRGTLRLVDESTGDGQSSALGATGPGAFDVVVFAGTYDVLLEGGASQNALPDQNTIVQKGLALLGAATKTFNVTTATLSGSVTVNKAVMPDNSLGAGDRGSLRFVDNQSSDSLSVAIGSTGAAAYTVQLFTGSYDVILDGSSSQNAIPYQSTALQRGLAVAATSTKNFDATTLTLSGALTLNGVQLPDNTLGAGDRGALRFIDRQTFSSSSATLGATGPGSYSATLFAGSYDILLDGDSSQNAMPYQSTVLQRGAALSASASRNFDAKTATLTGVVTVGGAQMADNSLGAGDRGQVRFVDALGAGSISGAFGATGPAMFTVTLFQGTYDVLLDGDSSQDAIPYQTVQLKTGCLTDPSCTSSRTDVSGDWSVTTTAPYSWNMTLMQSGGTLNGTFHDSLGYSGALQNGTRNGDQVHFVISTNCSLPVDGVVASGCLMRGTLNCGYLFSWVAYRSN
jgi:hypothetical protein